MTLFPDKGNLLSLYNVRDHFKGFKFTQKEISLPLIKLLKIEKDHKTIYRYCDFIEDMWKNGDDMVKNIVNVQIIEDLSKYEGI